MNRMGNRISRATKLSAFIKNRNLVRNICSDCNCQSKQEREKNSNGECNCIPHVELTKKFFYGAGSFVGLLFLFDFGGK
jgi:hypothetical protein